LATSVTGELRIALLALLAAGCSGSKSGPGSGAPPLSRERAELLVALGGQYAHGTAVAFHGDELVVAGAVEGDLGGPWGDRLGRARGGGDAFVLRVAPAARPSDPTASSLRFGVRLGGSGEARATAVAVLADGAIAVAGTFAGHADLGGIPLESRGDPDGFVAVLEPGDGRARWATRIPATGYAIPRALAAADDGGAVVAGTFAGTIEAAGSALVSAGALDAFAVRFARDGEARWARRGGGHGADVATGVAALPGDIFVVGGSFSGDADLGGFELESADASQDVFFAALDAGGEVLWARAVGGPGEDAAHAITLVPGVGFAVGGSFEGEAFFGGAPLRSTAAATGFVAVYDHLGRHLGSTRAGADGGAVVLALAASGERIIAAGAFAGEADLAGDRFASAGGHDVFVLELTAAAEPAWAARLGGPGEDEPGAVAASGGSVGVTGRSSKALDAAGRRLPARGDRDAFLVLLSRE
jgi:hypothetical protein